MGGGYSSQSELLKLSQRKDFKGNVYPALFTLLVLCGSKAWASPQYSGLFQESWTQRKREDKSEQSQNECQVKSFEYWISSFKTVYIQEFTKYDILHFI